LRVSGTVGLVSIVLAATFLGITGQAFGHAQLISSSPTADRVLERVPEEVVFRFNESVSGDLGDITVFGPDGREVVSGKPEPDPRDPAVVSLAIPRSPDVGTYSAIYRVVSADSHPISGGISFTVRGSPSSGERLSEASVAPPRGSAPAAVSEPQGAASTGVIFWLLRFLALGTTALLAGVLVFLWTFEALRSGSRRSAGAVPRAGILVGLALTIGAGATLLMIPTQGASIEASNLGSGFDPKILQSVVETRFGMANLVRTAGFLAFIPLALDLIRGRAAGLASVITAMLGSVVLFITPGQAGHAATADPALIIVPASIVHTASMAIWGGGLIALALLLPGALNSESRGRQRTVLETLERFSPVALVCALLLAVSGTAQSLVEVGSLGALIDTAFGRLVLAKVAIFLVLIVFGWNNRSRLLPLLAGFVAKRSARDTSTALGRSIVVAAFLIGLALMLTSALVAEEPEGLAPAGPPSGVVESSGYRLDYSVTPGVEGRNEIDLRLEGGAERNPPSDASLTASSGEGGPGSVDLELRKLGNATFTSPSAILDSPGEWKFRAEFRTGRFDLEVFEFEAEIASGG
jgi:copper transport protein